MGFPPHAIAILFIASLLVGAGNGRPQWLRLGGRELVPRSNRHSFFDAELFQAVLRNARDDNVLISPISVKILLAMLMEGTTGETSEQIKTALRLSSNIEDARKVVSNWISTLTGTQLSIVSVATQLFVDSSVTPAQSFKTIVEQHYGGGVTKVSMVDSENAAERINQWVRKRTHDLISTLVSADQLSSGAKAVLASAVYFKSKWMHPFNRNKTSEDCFAVASGKCQKTKFMYGNEYLNYAYIDSVDAQALEIPYQDPQFSMLMLLPKHNIHTLARDLAQERLQTIIQQLKPQEIHMQIPRFHISTHLDIADTLRELRVDKVLSTETDFQKIVSGNSTLAISNIIHSTKLMVNEEGSEGASATGAVFVPLMGTISTRFIANRPFFFFIRDTVHDNILFAGRFSKPTEEEQPFSYTPNLEVEAVDMDVAYELAPPIRKKPVSSQIYIPQAPGKPSDKQSIDLNNNNDERKDTSQKREEMRTTKRSSEGFTKIHFISSD